MRARWKQTSSWPHYAIQCRAQHLMEARMATLWTIRCLGHHLPRIQMYPQSSVSVLVTNCEPVSLQCFETFLRVSQSVSSLWVQLCKTVVLTLGSTYGITWRQRELFSKWNSTPRDFDSIPGAQVTSKYSPDWLRWNPGRAEENRCRIFLLHPGFLYYKPVRCTSSGVPSGDKHEWRACHEQDTRKSVENKTDMPLPSSRWQRTGAREEAGKLHSGFLGFGEHSRFLCPLACGFTGFNNISLSSSQIPKIPVFWSGKQTGKALSFWNFHSSSNVYIFWVPLHWLFWLQCLSQSQASQLWTKIVEIQIRLFSVWFPWWLFFFPQKNLFDRA